MLKVLQRFLFFHSALLPGPSMHSSYQPCQDNKILHPESVVKESPDKSLGREQVAKRFALCIFMFLLLISMTLFSSTMSLQDPRSCKAFVSEAAGCNFGCMSHKRGSKHEQT